MEILFILAVAGQDAMKPQLVPSNRIVDGAIIFKIMDTHGTPLEIINEMLRAEGAGFSVIQFVEAALASKNYTYETIKRRLLADFVGDKEFMSQLLDGFAEKLGWVKQ